MNSLSWIFVGLVLVTTTEEDEVRMSTYFPEYADDPSEIRWAHAVNSREALRIAVEGDADMIETDVSLGTIAGVHGPVIGHPPLTEPVDVDLHGWLEKLISLKKDMKHRGRHRRLGVKLDFKSFDVIQSALAFEIISRLFDEIDFPIWFNADVLAGPVNATHTPVNAFTFLFMCNANFPDSIVSVGWTTTLDMTSTQRSDWRYEWDHVVSMADLLHKVNSTQSRTFAVRAAFVARSIDRLQWLLGVVPESTLTVWSAEDDTDVSSDDLMGLRNSLPVSTVYYDLPKRLDDDFRLAKSKVDVDVASRRESKGLSHRVINECILQSGLFVAFIKPCNNTIHVTNSSSKSHDLVRGTIEFLRGPEGRLRTAINDDDGQSLVFGVGGHQVLIEQSGMVHEVRASKIVNTTKLARSRCYAFQMNVGRLPASLLHVHLWSTDCAAEYVNDPCKPITDVDQGAFFAVLGDNNGAIGAGGSIGGDVGGLLLLGVESRGDSYKMIHNCDKGDKLIYAGTSESTANAIRFNGYMVALMYVVVSINMH